jgi:hypothetical protein
MRPEILNQIIYATPESPLGNLIDQSLQLIRHPRSERLYNADNFSRDLSLIISGVGKGVIVALSAWRIWADGGQLIQTFIQNTPQNPLLAPWLGFDLFLGIAGVASLHLLQERYLRH